MYGCIWCQSGEAALRGKSETYIFPTMYCVSCVSTTCVLANTLGRYITLSNHGQKKPGPGRLSGFLALPYLHAYIALYIRLRTLCIEWI